MADLLRDYGERWTFEPATVGSPAVATGFTRTFPGSEVTRVLSVSFVLVTDANAANRIVRVEYLNASGDVFAAVAAPFLQVASITTRYTFAVGLQTFGAASAAFMGGPLPDFVLMDGLAVRVAIAAVQAGDQLSGASLFVAQSTVRPDEGG